MGDILDIFRNGPRKIAVTGHFGSGKTEFTVSLAMALAASGTKPLAVCDLDIENPYFRSRERQSLLENAGIRVYSDPFDGRNASELQTISATIRAPLEDADCMTLCDCGGDHAGAMILNQFRKYFQEDSRLLCVVNCNRPGTDTPEKAVDHLRAIEHATGLRADGLISNAHLLRLTTPEDVVSGWGFTETVSKAVNVPALCACCTPEIAGELGGADIPLFPIGMYMRESYLDKNI